MAEHSQEFDLDSLDDLPRTLRNCVAYSPSVFITLPAVEALKLARRIEDNRPRVQTIEVARTPTGWDFFLYAFVAGQAATNLLVPYIKGFMQ